MELLGSVETVVLAAVDRGALRVRCTATRVPALRDEPDGEHLLHTALHRCAEDGLVRRRREDARRSWVVTAKGRARLRAQRRFGQALAGALARTRAATHPEAHPARR